MDFMPGYLLRMIFHRFDLSLPVFRGSKGQIWMKSLMQQLWRAYHIHTPLVSVNAVNMWCMGCGAVCMHPSRSLGAVPGPRHVRYAILSGPTVSCLPLHHAHPPLRVPDLTYLSVTVSVSLLL